MNQNYTKTRFIESAKRDLVWQVLTPYLRQKFQLSGPILDVGCGYGQFVNNFQSEKRFALDFNPEMKNFLLKDILFKSGSATTIGGLFSGTSFGTIFSSNLLEHLTRIEIDSFMDQAHSLLAKDGKLVLLIPNYRYCSAQYFDDYTHLTPLSHEGLKDWLVSRGYKIDFCHPRFMPFTLKNSRLPVNALMIKLWLAWPWKIIGKQMLIVASKA